MVTMIKCEDCGKEIEKKWRRVVCVKCANKRNKEVAKAYREMKKSKAMQTYYKKTGD